ncbi:hypothetical protein F5Y16DRAFT_385050 [Xylariaceae sp. FL0255]|nr:hypothetical protein F5Y16DRAFT_385050 [Xylariaceae sp. FL0255]
MPSIKKIGKLFSPDRRRAQPGAADDALDSDSSVPNPSNTVKGLFPGGANSLGLKELHNAADAMVDIVFLHGLTGGAYTTFLDKTSQTYWPIDLLPNDIRGARLFAFGYDADVAHWFAPAGQNTLQDHASNLLNSLASKRAQTSSTTRKIIFVAHSLGGLVAKRAISLSEIAADDHLKQIEKETIGIAFLGTPHRGSDLAPFTKAIANIVKASRKRINTDILEVLRRDSQVLAAVDDVFSNWLRKTTGRFHLTCFFEELQFPGVGMVVKRESAIIAGWPSMSIHANHDMPKFTNTNDDGYQRVTGELSRWIGQLNLDIPQSVGSFLSAQVEEMGTTLDHILHRTKSPFDDTSFSEDTVRWFVESEKFQVWQRQSHHAFLWFYGDPGAGKTFLMTYVLHYLRRQFASGTGSGVISVFCSQNQSEELILLSLMIQMAKSKAFEVGSETTIQSLGVPTSHLTGLSRPWAVVEGILSVTSVRELVLLFDGIDELDPMVLSSFLKNLRGLESRITTSDMTIRIIISSRPQPAIKQALSHYASIDTDVERQDCLKSLYFKEWNAREAKIEEARQGGDWLSSHEVYRKWAKSPNSEMLWIEGKPGSGKSMLSKRIVQTLRSKYHLPDPDHPFDEDSDENSWTNFVRRESVIAAFYYSFRGGLTETSHTLMLRSIVYQIFLYERRLFYLLRDLYRTLRVSGAPNKEGKSIWKYKDLKSVLHSLHQISFPLQVIIALDGLDESDGPGRDDVLSFLSDLIIRSGNESGKCVVKVLISCRPEPDIKLRLRQASHIVLQRENAGDIKKMVNKWIERINYPDLQSNDLSGIRRQILSTCEGVFLWVSLVLQDIERLLRRGGYSIASLEERIHKLPKELGGPNGYYHEIVQSLLRTQEGATSLDERDIEEQREVAKKVFTWVTFPKQPISLEELVDVLATPSNLSGTDHADYDFEKHRPRDLERGLMSYCGNLLEVIPHENYLLRESKSIVQLIHQTVREFLLDRRRIATPYDIDEQAGDILISMTCLSYIRTIFAKPIWQTPFNDNEPSQVDAVVTCLNESKLLLYSLSHLSQHLNHLGDLGIDLKRAMMVFIEDIMSQPTSIVALLLSKWTEGLWWYHGLKLPTDRNNIEACLGHALLHAAEKGAVIVTELLLSSLEANVAFRSEQGVTALQIAARCGHDIVARILVFNGADIKAHDGQEGTALQIAARFGHEDFVHVLLLETADTEIANEYGTALQIAARYGHKRIVEDLVEEGANVNAQGGKEGTALQLAIRYGHKEIAGLLVEKGADISVLDQTEKKSLYG